MTGANTMRLNEATMIEAMQFWLNAEMKVAPKVTGVASADTYGTTFDVYLTSEATHQDASGAPVTV